MSGIGELDVAVQHQQCRLAWTFVLTESVSGGDADQQVMQAVTLANSLTLQPVAAFFALARCVTPCPVSESG
ncbi:MAG: hypothetical protein ABS81_27120 [Pseudonocardia sp. SCN 72-86]|nr:MAG: hypothetical protein ABS81_27120 [Pseudonocardia sp. SCN 72-86]